MKFFDKYYDNLIMIKNKELPIKLNESKKYTNKLTLKECWKVKKSLIKKI